MTEPPKKEPAPETDTAPSQDNVIDVDFGTPLASMQVFIVRETNVVGLHFSRPIDEFVMDPGSAKRLSDALAHAHKKLTAKW